MFNKIYEKIKEFIQKHWKYLLLLFAAYLILTFPLPYYIYSGGGTINVENRIKIEDSTTSSGSFHFAYVRELKGNVATFLLAKLNSFWEIEKEEDVKLSKEETQENVDFRNHISLEQANQTATMIAYQKAEKGLSITGKHFYIVYLDEKSETTLKVGDEILSVDGQSFSSVSDYSHYISSKQIGDRISFSIKRDKKTTTATAIVKDYNGKRLTGISLSTLYDFKTDPALTFQFNSSESGPSGGLMLTLAIYDKLVKEDITHGKKIVGTGTMEEDGSVGEIGGVKYKLKGAVDSHADIFLVPAGDNYEEAIKEQEKYHYDIKIYAVRSFEEALLILSDLS